MDVCVKNSLESWVRLLKFPVHCLRLPESVDSVDQKLTVALNAQIQEERPGLNRDPYDQHDN